MKKDNSIPLLLCVLGFCGLGGLHDFYYGCWWLALIKLFTCNFFWIGTIIDTILIFSNSYYIRPAQPKTQFKTQAPVQQAYTPAPTTNAVDRISEQGTSWKNGTDNQIDWAEGIVRRLLERAETLANAAVKQGKIDETEKDELIEELEDTIIFKDDANWWIDNRDKSTKNMLYELLPEEMHDTIKLL